MKGNLLIRKKGAQTLDAFVASSFTIIGCSNWEERQSSNYVEERYFRCSVLGMEVTIAMADDAEFDRFDFWVSISPATAGIADKTFLAGVGDCAARAFALQGYEVFSPTDMARTGCGGALYRLNSVSNAGLQQRIIVEEV